MKRGSHNTETAKQKRRESLKNGRIKCICSECGNILERTPSDVKRKLHIFCNSICYGKWRSKNLIGENNPMYGRQHSDATKEKIRKNRRTLYGKDHPMWGRHHTYESRLKISAHHADMRGEKSGRYGRPSPRAHGQWFIKFNDIRVWMRSSYEIRVANILETLNISWSYESKRFVLHELKNTYCPDFYLYGCHTYLEVKGYLGEKAKLRIDTFKKQYPEENLVMLYKEDIEKLESEIFGE